eukprot:ANDGO_05879.mRNA.1 hypothetical protein
MFAIVDGEQKKKRKMLSEKRDVADAADADGVKNPKGEKMFRHAASSSKAPMLLSMTYQSLSRNKHKWLPHEEAELMRQVEIIRPIDDYAWAIVARNLGRSLAGVKTRHRQLAFGGEDGHSSHQQSK